MDLSFDLEATVGRKLMHSGPPAWPKPGHEGTPLPDVLQPDKSNTETGIPFS